MGAAMTSAGIPTWAPLRSPVYRALWIAQLVSNLGTWMQTVGAQWMLVGDPRAAVLVPLVESTHGLVALEDVLQGPPPGGVDTEHHPVRGHGPVDEAEPGAVRVQRLEP